MAGWRTDTQNVFLCRRSVAGVRHQDGAVVGANGRLTIALVADTTAAPHFRRRPFAIDNSPWLPSTNSQMSVRRRVAGSGSAVSSARTRVDLACSVGCQMSVRGIACRMR